MIGDAGEQVGDVVLRVESVELGALNRGTNRRGAAAAGIESGAMVPVELAPDDGRARRTDREGVIETVFGCGARVRLRGEVSAEALRQVFELLR